MTRRRYFPLTPVGRARDSSNILRISSPSDSTDASETAASGPLVLEWLDSETLEWGDTTLARTTGEVTPVSNGELVLAPPIVEYARLRNVAADAVITWSLSYDLVPVSGWSESYANLTTVWSEPSASAAGIFHHTAGVIVPQHVVQPNYADPEPEFTTLTAVTLVELTALDNSTGLSYGPIYLVITGQGY